MTREEVIKELSCIADEMPSMECADWIEAISMAIKALEPKTIQEIQAESEKYQKAFEDGYEQGYAQARFDYEQESKTGYWIEHNTGHSRYYSCSKCSCVAPYTEVANGVIWKLSKYCPNCGAKMESEG